MKKNNFAAKLFKRTKKEKQTQQKVLRQSPLANFKFDDLPYELVDKIVRMLPWQTQRQMLKSKTIGRVVHNVYYETVVVFDSWKSFRDHFSSGDSFKMGRFDCFADVPKFMRFCRANPLYTPNTLYYYNDEVLKSIERIQKPLLKKFKRFYKFGYEHSGSPSLGGWDSNHKFDEEFIARKSFFMDGPSRFPISYDGISVIEPYRAQQYKLIDTVFLGSSLGIILLDNLPNLVKLKIDRKANSIEEGYDFRSLKKLKDLELTLHGRSIGVSTGAFHVLPSTLRTLSLIEVDPADKLSDIHKLTYLLKLSISFTDEKYPILPHERDIEIGLPNSLLELNLAGDAYKQFDKMVFPEFLETVTFKGSIPLSECLTLPKRLKSFHVYEGGTSCIFSHFSSFRKLSCLSVPYQCDTTLPKNLNYLQIRYCNAQTSKIVSGCSKLITLDQHFRVLTPVSDPCFPSSLTSLKWTSADIKSRLSSQNITRLRLVSCIGEKSFKKLVNLKSLELSMMHIGFMSLPDSLISLKITQGSRSTSFKCPASLKNLEITSDQQLMWVRTRLNGSLETLKLVGIECNIRKMLKHTGYNFKAINLRSCRLHNFGFDLSSTSLRVFEMSLCTFKRNQVVFPATLNTLDSYDKSTHETFAPVISFPRVIQRNKKT